jgi:LacI family transcriptional regulator
MKRRITSQQVAKRAGVSRTTVSFVLNDVSGAGISEETRKRVLEVAKELGYVPNAAARSLVSGQTKTVGLVVSQAEHLQVDAFISQLMYSLTSCSRLHGYQVLLETANNSIQPGAYLQLIKGRHIDGLIVLNPRSDDAELAKLIESGFPIVLLGRLRQVSLSAPVYSVGSDNRSAARRLTKHLIGLGHRRIAHITFSPEDYYATQVRLSAYRQALEEANLEYNPDLIAYGSFSAASGFAAMEQLLKRRPLPDAVFAGNDTIALGAMSVIHQHGLRIPQDIAMVGFDDLPFAPFTVPPLTTVRSPAIEQGRVAAEMLMQLMRDETPARQTQILEIPLVVRESCGARLAVETP